MAGFDVAGVFLQTGHMFGVGAGQLLVRPPKE